LIHRRNCCIGGEPRARRQEIWRISRSAAEATRYRLGKAYVGKNRPFGRRPLPGLAAGDIAGLRHADRTRDSFDRGGMAVAPPKCDTLGGMARKQVTKKPPTNKEFSERFPARDSTAVRALAENVRRSRVAKKWSQERLFDEAGIEQASISLIENGRANPTLRAIESIAAALGIEVSELLEPPAPPKRSKETD
jgi:ribosome-binding protein aMBF1 (putative translation factor)